MSVNTSKLFCSFSSIKKIILQNTCKKTGPFSVLEISAAKRDFLSSKTNSISRNARVDNLFCAEYHFHDFLFSGELGESNWAASKDENPQKLLFRPKESIMSRFLMPLIDN